MEEKSLKVGAKKNKKINDLPKGYVEDNSLKILVDDTIDLGEVVSEIVSFDEDNNTNEIDVSE